MPSIADLLADKIKSEELSNLAAAKKVGVSVPSLRGVLNGKLPNARTTDKFAKFIGISEDELKAMVASAKGDGGGKPAKRGRGRPPGSGKGKRRGRPPGSGKGKRGRRAAAAGGDLGAALAAIQSSVEAAQGILADELAVSVHNLDAGKRKLLTTLIQGW